MAFFLRLPPLGLQPLFDFRPAWLGFLAFFRPLAGLGDQRRQPLDALAPVVQLRARGLRGDEDFIGLSRDPRASRVPAAFLL